MDEELGLKAAGQHGECQCGADRGQSGCGCGGHGGHDHGESDHGTDPSAGQAKAEPAQGGCGCGCGHDQGNTTLDELNDAGAGAGVTDGAPSTFEPEEPEHPADDK